MVLRFEMSILCCLYQIPRKDCVPYGAGHGETSARVCEQPFLQNIVERYPSFSCSFDHTVCVKTDKRIPIMRNAKDNEFLYLKKIL